jgi:hypothetical protein
MSGTRIRVFVASPSDVERERDSLLGVVNELDTGKDSGQKLMDVSYRSAVGPCTPFWTRQRVVHGPRTTHPTDIMGAGCLLNPLRSHGCNPLQIL